MLTGSLGMLPSASLGEAGAPGPVRAGARLGARHRRPGRRQPAGDLPQHGDDAAPRARPAGAGRADRGGGRRRARAGPAHARSGGSGRCNRRYGRDPTSARCHRHTSRRMETAELIWQNGEFVPWHEATDARAQPRPALRHRRLRGRALLRDRARPGDLPPQGPPRPARQVGRALLLRAALLGRGDRRGDARADPPQRAALLLHPPARLPRLRQPRPLRDRRADRRRHRRLPLGRLPRRGGPAQRHPRQGLELAADQPRRADPARQGVGPVPQLDPRQDRVARTPATRRRSCSTSGASSARARARTSSSSATARSSPRRTSPRSSTASTASR